jgi:gamma-glutamylcyclotransferase (GGCT)/AIG2-like uncharacterized protein YtfP
VTETKHLPVFVYGTLRRGQSNYSILQGHTIREEQACLHGAQLYDLGFFPMAIEGEGVVSGELMHIRPVTYQEVLANLDMLEGVNRQAPHTGFYRRLARTVQAEDETEHLAWVYLGSDVDMQDHPRIPHGDWVRHLRESRAPFSDNE